MGKGHPEAVRDGPASEEGWGWGWGRAGPGNSHFLEVAGAPGPERQGRGWGQVKQDGWLVPPGLPRLPAETASRLLEVRRGAAQALAWTVTPIPVRGLRGWRGDTHRHGGARGRREQRAGGWKGLSGRAPRSGNPAAAAPLGRPQPLLRPFPFPALPRPLPSAHKTFFFFFKLPGRTRAGQWAAGTEGQTAAGAAGGPMGARAGPGAGPAATGRALWGGRARRIGAEGGEGRAPAAGRWEEGRTQRAGDSVGPPRGSAR